MQKEAFNLFLKGSKKELKKKIILTKNDKKNHKKTKNYAETKISKRSSLNMQPRTQTQNHPRLFIKFLYFLKSLKNIFTFFFLVPSIEHTNSERSRPHSLKSVNNFASYKRKTENPVFSWRYFAYWCKD